MTYNFTDYDRVVAIGNISNFQTNELKKYLSQFHDTVIIYTGDFNLDQSADICLDKLEAIEYTLASNNNYFLMVRGNKDNYIFYKAKSLFKKDLSEISNHIILIPDYYIVRTKKHAILCIGGGRTLDRNHGNPVNDTKDENVQRTRINLSDLSDIDIVVSHIAPLMVFPEELTKNKKHFNSPIIEAYAMYDKHLKTEVYKGRLILKNIYDLLSKNNKIHKWFYGHYDKSNIMTYNNTEFISLRINESKKI